MPSATERFSSRVADYARYRPSYPAAALDLLAARCGLGPGCMVADVGAGTGILTGLLLERGARVYAVEPNAEMRAAAQAALGAQPGFSAVASPAEAIELPAAAVDLVVAAQAFHWFERGRARAEFARILRPGGWVVLIWNERVVEATAFLRDYEQLLLDYCPEYRLVDHRNTGPEEVAAFYAPGEVAVAQFPNVQRFDYPGLEGRLLSCSYAPAAGEPNHRPMLDALAALFEREQRQGQVEVEYITRVYYGRLA